MTENPEATSNTTRKIVHDSIPLVVAGDLLFARSPNRDVAQLFRRYEAILEAFANMNSQERLLNYRFFVGLILTSHAKKTTDIATRKKLFDYKNALFFALANDRDSRRLLGFKYLISKNFRVTKFCPSCEKENEGSGLSRHKWKFCKDCEIDRKFYNVLSIHHRFKNGSSTLFLSNDLIPNIQNYRSCPKGKLEEFREEAKYQKYHYNVKNLDVFELNSVIKAQQKLLEQN